MFYNIWRSEILGTVIRNLPETKKRYPPSKSSGKDPLYNNNSVVSTDPPPSNNFVKNKQLSGLGKVHRAHKIQHCFGGRGEESV